MWATAAALPACLQSDERLVLLCLDDDEVAWRAHVPAARVMTTDLPIASVSQHLHWQHLVRDSGADVVHYHQFDLPLAGVPAVACVHDLTVVDEPTYFGAGRSARRLAAAALLSGTCARADRIVTPSHASAAAIVRLHPRVAARLRVVVPGPSPPPKQPATTTVKPWDFVYVGNHRPHKRVELLLQAFQEVVARHPEARLTLIGRSDPRFPDVPRLARAAVGVSLVEGADDDAVAARLQSASALVFASVGEGYGFPVVEAFATGTPVIVADAGSLPEVTGDAGLVVAKDDVGAWAAAMERLGGDAALRASLQAAARAQAARLDWRDTARQLVTVWREVLC